MNMQPDIPLLLLYAVVLRHGLHAIVLALCCGLQAIVLALCCDLQAI